MPILEVKGVARGEFMWTRALIQKSKVYTKNILLTKFLRINKVFFLY